MMFFKLILSILFLSFIVSCTSNIKDEVDIDDVESFNIFQSKKLNHITNDFVDFLHLQKDSTIHDQYIMLSFYQRDKELSMNVSTGRFIGVHIDSLYDWLYMTEYKNSKIFISDRKEVPIGMKFYESNELLIVDDKEKYEPNVPYQDIIFEEMLWSYEIVDDKFVLIDKTH